MARLVAVRVLPNHTGDVRLVAAGHLGVAVEQGVQKHAHGFFTAHEIDVVGDIVGHVSGVLPAVGFSEEVVYLCGVKGR